MRFLPLPTPSPCKRRKLLCMVGVYLGTAAASQAQTTTSEPATTLKEVVVISSRYELARDDLAASSDVIDAKDIEQRLMGDIRDVARDLPNVSVKRAPARFSVTGRGNPVGADGNAGFSIRGQGGNRVTMLTDGIRLARSYINGSNAFGRDAVALESLKRIEIVRGPTSVLYGSDGLAGLVNFITHDPADFLLQEDGTLRTAGGKAWTGYSSDDRGSVLGGTVAGRASDSAQWLLSGTLNHSHGLDNMGENDADNLERTTPNPQTNRNLALLAKIVLRPTSAQRHVLTYEHLAKDSDFELLSSRAKPPITGSAAQKAAAVVSETSSSTLDRHRLTWSARFVLDAVLADSVQTVLSWQDSAAQQAGQTVRNDGGVRVRDTSYDERSWQAGLQAYKFDQLSPTWSHAMTYGFDHASIDVSSFADGRDPTPPGPYQPKHYFPDTRDSSDAIFFQSELTHENWSITPGVRLDHFSLDVRSQAGYYPTASATPGKSLSGSAASPKLGVMFQATPEWSLWGNYASGFRAPEAQQVNNVFEGFNARLLPNPNLEPEKSRNFELGARLRRQRHLLDLAIFTSRYSNLIVEKKNLGTVLPGPPSATNPTLFQTVNVGEASISGFEVKGVVDWGRAMGGELTMPFAYGRVKGSDDTTGLPLNAVDPPKFALGLRYDSAALTLRLDLLHRIGKSADDLDSPLVPRSTTLQFTPPSATTLDLSGQWRIQNGVRLGFAITNLTDKKYWNWSDVQGLASNGTPVVVDAYSQPGRSLAVSLVADF